MIRGGALDRMTADGNSSDALNSSFVSASDDERTETNMLLSRMSQENPEVAGSGEGLVASDQPISAASYGTDDGPSSDEHPDQSEVKRDTTAFVYLLTFLSAIGGFLFGYDTGIISGAIVLLREYFLLTYEWEELIVSATMAAAAVFSVLSSFTNDRFGRKPTILTASIVFTVGALLLAGAPDRFVLLVGRFILGIGIGMYLQCSVFCWLECVYY